jgi:hypothetical protein
LVEDKVCVCVCRRRTKKKAKKKKKNNTKHKTCKHRGVPHTVPLFHSAPLFLFVRSSLFHWVIGLSPFQYPHRPAVELWSCPWPTWVYFSLFFFPLFRLSLVLVQINAPKECTAVLQPAFPARMVTIALVVCVIRVNPSVLASS